MSLRKMNVRQIFVVALLNKGWEPQDIVRVIPDTRISYVRNVKSRHSMRRIEPELKHLRKMIRIIDGETWMLPDDLKNRYEQKGVKQ